MSQKFEASFHTHLLFLLQVLSIDQGLAIVCGGCGRQALLDPLQLVVHIEPELVEVQGVL